MATTDRLEGIVAQMHERLGSIEATQRAMQAQLNGLATVQELRAWVAFLVAFVGASVTVLLKYG